MKKHVSKISMALVFLALFTSCKITMVTSKKVGETIKLKIEAKPDQQENVWIDLNNNGKKDNGEAVTEFGKHVDYTIGSQTIDIYGNIIFLSCARNQLTSLVSNNNELERLNCEGNQLTNLNISGNPKLKNLSCSSNKLETLDVSKNIDLETLNFTHNLLTEIELEKNPNLTAIFCRANKLKTLDVSKNPKLKLLHCQKNPNLTKINVANGNNINFTNIWGNDSPTFDATRCPKLECIKVDKGFNPDNQNGMSNKWKKDARAVWNNSGNPCPSKIIMTTTKPVGEKIKLKIEAKHDQQENVWIDLNNNGKKDNGEAVTEFGKHVDYTIGSQTINIYGNMIFLSCSRNQLTSLVSNNNELERLNCEGNQLTSLDISENPGLKNLYCSFNRLETLDVSKNIDLETLHFTDNLLIEIELEKNSNLTSIFCRANKLKTLDVSKNPKLKLLHCQKNPNLTKINVANGNNINFTNIWGNDSPTFDATRCPKLECIKVDKGFNPDNQNGMSNKWKKDATASYRNNGSNCP